MTLVLASCEWTANGSIQYSQAQYTEPCNFGLLFTFAFVLCSVLLVDASSVACFWCLFACSVFASGLRACFSCLSALLFVFVLCCMFGALISLTRQEIRIETKKNK